MVVSCIAPPFPRELVLQHVPTVIAFAFLVSLPRRFPLSNVSFTCLVAFLALHILGARYIYSFVPYDDWIEALLDVRLADRFHLVRNHYDRVVHFCFGLLFLAPVWEVTTKYFQVPKGIAHMYSLDFVLAFSMLYEIFEWGLGVALAPADAEAYNGQQGDMWDAQKDMSLAVVGALVGLFVLAVAHYRAGGRDRG